MGRSLERTASQLSYLSREIHNYWTSLISVYTAVWSTKCNHKNNKSTCLFLWAWNGNYWLSYCSDNNCSFFLVSGEWFGPNNFEETPTMYWSKVLWDLVQLWTDAHDTFWSLNRHIWVQNPQRNKYEDYMCIFHCFPPLLNMYEWWCYVHSDWLFFQ